MRKETKVTLSWICPDCRRKTYQDVTLISNQKGDIIGVKGEGILHNAVNYRVVKSKR